MKHILIRESHSTAALEATGTAENLVLIKVDGATDEALANTILAGINDNQWLSSDTAVAVEGDTTDGIKLPKKAIDS